MVSIGGDSDLPSERTSQRCKESTNGLRLSERGRRTQVRDLGDFYDALQAQLSADGEGEAFVRGLGGAGRADARTRRLFFRPRLVFRGPGARLRYAGRRGDGRDGTFDVSGWVSFGSVVAFCLRSVRCTSKRAYSP